MKEEQSHASLQLEVCFLEINPEADLGLLHQSRWSAL